MSESTSWTDQWFKAQQQFVDAWSEMAKSGTTGSQASQSELWAQSFELWRKACGGQSQPDVQQAMDKCLNMGKEYFAMAEQISKSMADGASPVEGINQWMDQLRQSLQQYSGVPGFNGNEVNDFMKQWFTPTSSWQQMANAFAPMNQAAWQLPGMNTSVFNMGEAIDPMGKILSSPGIGYFREPQEKQQKGVQLSLDYHQSNFAFNQAFLRVALESIRDFQTRLLKLDADTAPRSLREVYDLWVEISEEHYAVFAMSEEYQALYGDMVNRLMIVKKHYSEITDDTLRAMNLPHTREVDTMQQRLQELRRENFALKKEIREIRSMVQQLQDAGEKATQKPAASPKSTSTRKAKSVKPVARKKAVKPKPKPKAGA